MKIRSINSTALQLGWNLPSLPNGIIVAYHMEYNRSASDIWESTLYSNTTTLIVAGLDEYTVYNFSLYASTRIGDGPTAVILGRTNESRKEALYKCTFINIEPTTDPHSPPRDIEVFNVGKRSVQVSWIPPMLEDHNGPLAHYEIQFLQSQFDTIPTVAIRTVSLSASYFDLEEFINYTVVVAAATSSGLGPFSSPIAFITREAGIVYSSF